MHQCLLEAARKLARRNCGVTKLLRSCRGAGLENKKWYSRMDIFTYRYYNQAPEDEKPQISKPSTIQRSATLQSQ
jgi:hypothetical protein